MRWGNNSGFTGMKTEERYIWWPTKFIASDGSYEWVWLEWATVDRYYSKGHYFFSQYIKYSREDR